MRKLLLIITGLTKLYAQQTTTTAGGEATGSSGSSSFTVGQTVYTTNTGTNGNSQAQGVQQPFEISVVSGIVEAKGINMTVSAYPNPTTGFLTVTVKNYKTTNLQYLVYDISGKLLQTVKATATETQINISKYVPATYFVKVIDNNKEIKVFKIIKK